MINSLWAKVNVICGVLRLCRSWLPTGGFQSGPKFCFFNYLAASEIVVSGLFFNAQNGLGVGGSGDAADVPLQTGSRRKLK